MHEEGKEERFRETKEKERERETGGGNAGRGKKRKTSECSNSWRSRPWGMHNNKKMIYSYCFIFHSFSLKICYTYLSIYGPQNEMKRKLMKEM